MQALMMAANGEGGEVWMIKAQFTALMTAANVEGGEAWMIKAQFTALMLF